MSALDIVIIEHEGPVSSSAALMMPTTIDLPPEDPRSLLYLLDSELERIALQAHAQAQAQAAAEAEAEAAEEELALLSEMMENEMLLDALGRRTLAIAGMDCPPVFFEPFFGYVTKEQSTSYAPVEYSGGYKTLPNNSVPRRFQRAPVMYAHEEDPQGIRARDEDHSLDWLARELIAANASRGAQIHAPPTSSDGSRAQKLTQHESLGGRVYVIDDGSIGVADENTVGAHEMQPVIPSYQVEYYDDDDDDSGAAAVASSGETILIPPPAAERPSSAHPFAFEEASKPATNLDAKASTTASTGTSSGKARAATVMDEDEEWRLETEGLPAGTAGGPPRKTAKTQH